MPARLHVHFLPSLTSPEELAGGVVVVIDVLRASTTICHALAVGAREVIPCLEVDEARSTAAKFPSHEVVLGGERNGLKIDGFDLGNSPGEYTPESVGGKTVVFSTTNGTKAMTQCREAKQVLVGALVNAGAVAACLRDEPNVHLLCAGTRGRVSREDVHAAALMMLRLEPLDERELNDDAVIALGAMDGEDAASTSSDLHFSRGGSNLTKLGLEDDIEAAGQVDQFDFAPELDLAKWRIVRP